MRALQHRTNTALHWFDPFGSVDIKDLCSVPPLILPDTRLIFWDQEPVYRDTAKKFFDQFCETYIGPKIIVTSERQSSDLSWVCDTYGIKSAYYFFHGWAALDWYRGYDHSYLGTPWQDREFLHRIFCPNNIVGGRRKHRLEMISALNQRGLIHGNQISFPDVCPYENRNTVDLLAEHGLPSLSVDLPLVIDRTENHAHSSHRIDFWDQAQSCFCHVVTETVYDSTRLHLTEKSFKPIVLQQPFMLAAPRGSLSYLREYGFLTFESLWDESYDDAPDDIRISMIADNLNRINQWSAAELSDAQHQAQSIVEHNHRWFYKDFQDILWKELVGMLEDWR